MGFVCSVPWDPGPCAAGMAPLGHVAPQGSRAQTPPSGGARLTHWLLPDALPRAASPVQICPVCGVFSLQGPLPYSCLWETGGFTALPAKERKLSTYLYLIPLLSTFPSGEKSTVEFQSSCFSRAGLSCPSRKLYLGSSWCPSPT